MKTIGIIGGITWLSTVDYYRLINQMVAGRLGGSASAKIIIYSLSFEQIKGLVESGDWDGVSAITTDVARNLERGGADCLIIAANTIHNVAAKIQAAVNIPLIHIADETAGAIKRKKLQTVALLGTKYTMQMDFYKNKLLEHGITVIIPREEDIEYINTAIFTEMSKGIFLPERKEGFLRIIRSLTEQGAEGAVLGCTEIPILIKQEDCDIPIFDTTFIHATAAVEFALG
jgi:aspartate racemase